MRSFVERQQEVRQISVAHTWYVTLVIFTKSPNFM